ncbi:MAG: hypothetical protein RQ741_14375 [Wenzhouxiangellaceae bacterium]|nr:hypothetical protein [Wenzhouxiangellaceae bacterium]
MRRFAELKRRNVFRVALFCLVAAWLVVQVAETILPLFEVPDGVLRGLIVLLAPGFVPALVFAWAFEMTPDGLRRETEAAVAVAPKVRRQTGQKLNWATLVVALLAIGLLAFDWLMTETRAPDASNLSAATSADANGRSMSDTAPARSIAVLAFDDLSPDADQAYFTEGVAEELLNLLARIDGFKVAARTSSFKFRGTDAWIWLEDYGGIKSAEAFPKAEQAARPVLERLVRRGGLESNSEGYDIRLARITSVEQDREATLADFRAAVASGFRAAWIIDRDPYFSVWREDPKFIALAAEFRRLNDIERGLVANVNLQP